jgi:hypothetical protein
MHPVIRLSDATTMLMIPIAVNIAGRRGTSIGGWYISRSTRIGGGSGRGSGIECELSDIIIRASTS